MKGDCFSCEKMQCCAIRLAILEIEMKTSFIKAHSKFYNALAEQCKYYKVVH